MSLFFLQQLKKVNFLHCWTVDTVGVNRLQMLAVQTACGHTKQTVAIEQRARWMWHQKARSLCQDNVEVLKAAAA